MQRRLTILVDLEALDTLLDSILDAVGGTPPTSQRKEEFLQAWETALQTKLAELPDLPTADRDRMANLIDQTRSRAFPD